VATRPHFSGFEATSLVASVTPSRILAVCPVIQVAARPNPAVSSGGMPAHCPRCWVLPATFCQC